MSIYTDSPVWHWNHTHLDDKKYHIWLNSLRDCRPPCACTAHTHISHIITKQNGEKMARE